jgi:hypothetical protein
MMRDIKKESWWSTMIIASLLTQSPTSSLMFFSKSEWSFSIFWKCSTLIWETRMSNQDFMRITSFQFSKEGVIPLLQLQVVIILCFGKPFISIHLLMKHRQEKYMNWPEFNIDECENGLLGIFKKVFISMVNQESWIFTWY